jgi:hypothetical protein
MSTTDPGDENMTERLLTLTAAARLLGMSPPQLRARSERGTGPIPTKVDYRQGRPRGDGGRFQYSYSLAEIERWVNAEADAETAMAYWLGRLWYSIRAMEPAEIRAQLAMLSGMLPELRERPNLADVWANVGMAILADAQARGIDVTPPASDRAGRLPKVA